MSDEEICSLSSFLSVALVQLVLHVEQRVVFDVAVPALDVSVVVVIIVTRVRDKQLNGAGREKKEGRRGIIVIELDFADTARRPLERERGEGGKEIGRDVCCCCGHIVVVMR